MSKNLTFKCDLCKEIKHHGELNGLCWLSNNTFRFGRVDDAGTHICDGCMKQLEAELVKRNAKATEGHM